ncbi:Uncharacterised protein [uncultured archaeon]|nr:Uncharacterised protein [uncultured archaeon]
MLKRIRNSLILVALVVMAASALSVHAEDWSSYTPVHSSGSGDGDWWTTYPKINENSGATVSHPSWVLEALKEKPVLILVHSSDCKPCIAQIASIKAALETYGSSLNYFDLLGEGGGITKAIETLDVYNPAGGAQYVPTTIFVTLIKGSDGKVLVAWHSVIDAMSDKDLTDYIKDSIYYHQQNAAAWG